MVGDGVLRKDIERHIDELGIRGKVIITGLRTDIPMMLQAMDVFLFPSLHEGLPLSVLEAQASGLPCFLSDTISEEVGIGEDVYFIRSDYSADLWAHFISSCGLCLPRVERCILNHRLISEAGYNIRTEAEKLSKLYLNSGISEI